MTASSLATKFVCVQIIMEGLCRDWRRAGIAPGRRSAIAIDGDGEGVIRCTVEGERIYGQGEVGIAQTIAVGGQGAVDAVVLVMLEFVFGAVDKRRQLQRYEKDSQSRRQGAATLS